MAFRLPCLSIFLKMSAQFWKSSISVVISVVVQFVFFFLIWIFLCLYSLSYISIEKNKGKSKLSQKPN